MKCLNCQEDLIQIPQKREKQFCNSTCRSNFWQKKKRKVQNGSPINPKSFEIRIPKNGSEKVDSENKSEKHPKYLSIDPREGSNGFFLKYGVFTYDEIK